MKQLIRVFFIVGFVLLTICAGKLHAQNCSLPEPFDQKAQFRQMLYLSPAGSDTEGDGTIERPFRTLLRTVEEVEPGTLIYMREGTYPGNSHISNLKGLPTLPIKIAGMPDEGPAIIDGGGTALQLSDPNYVILENFTIQHAANNGINIDDGGSYDSPAHHIILRNLTVKNVGRDGNQDGIKLSGLDQFRVENCTVIDPGGGGSAIDMVGCHEGVFFNNQIIDAHSSGIQAKGGSANILIYGNVFKNAGLRAINMGGSTGMPYFRPLDAPYEAAHITVWANEFIGAQTPVAFVGCENGLFAHNTIYLPRKWVVRILQETVGERFIACHNNVIANNIMVIDNQVNTFVNVGPNTRPDTFRFANNLWFHTTNSNFRGPSLPVGEQNSVVQKDPQFKDLQNHDFRIEKNSPAIGKGVDLSNVIGDLPITIPVVGDKNQNCYSTPPTLGAHAKPQVSKLKDWNGY